MKVEVFVRVRCAGCAEIVVFCEADYRGQVYCGGGMPGLSPPLAAPLCVMGA